MRKRFAPIGVAALAALFFGCATAVPMRVTKPAEVNMAGARNIAVFDFTYPVQGITLKSEKEIFNLLLTEALDLKIEEDTIEKRIAAYASNNLVQSLVETDYFQVLSPKDVTQAMIGADNPNLGLTDVGLALGADAIIVGSVDVMTPEEKTYQKDVYVKDPKTKKLVKTKADYISRSIYIEITYRVLDAADGSMYASRTLENNQSREVKLDDKDKLPKYEDLYLKAIDAVVPSIAKQLAPYTVTEYRYLKEDKTKDPKMKQADEFVKGGIYQKALNLFMEVWESNQNPAAGFNAAIMLEAVGDIDGAIELMDNVMDISPDKDIMREYNRLLASKEQMETVAEQME